MAEYGNLNAEPKPQKPYEYAPIGIDPNNYDFNKMPHWTALIGALLDSISSGSTNDGG